jgi:predicted acetyltransferase
MNIEVQQASLEDKAVLRNLMELYAYDFSEFDQCDVDAHGLFGYNRLDHYWTESGRYPFLVRVEGKLAGLVLVRTLDESQTDLVRSISEFFILRKYRLQGIGKVVAQQIFDKFPGRWSVASAQWQMQFNRLTTAPNTACTRLVGVGAFFKPFLSFEFFRLPSRVASRPPAGNASR